MEKRSIEKQATVRCENSNC